MKARYRTHCRDCANRIHPGNDIERDQATGKFVHVDCNAPVLAHNQLRFETPPYREPADIPVLIDLFGRSYIAGTHNGI